MKCLKKLFVLLLCLTLITVLGAGAAFAKSKDDEEESDDYSVSDVYFDISDTAIYVGWTVGDGECKYTVQLYDSSDFKTKNKVGGAMTVGYNAEMVDVTQKILNEGSGTYYALVTCKKKPKGGSYASAYARETIYSDDLATIRKNRKEASQSEGSSGSGSSGTAVTGTDGGPGISGTGTSAETASGTASAGDSAAAGSWQALEDGKWAFVKSDGTRATGWFEADGKWYFSGEDGVMAASRWIPSASEEGVYYYVDETGAMMTNATTPDGYTVDADGKWRAA